MFAVWVDYPRLKVAGADKLEDAVYYAVQYVDEGKVSIRERNKIVATLLDISDKDGGGFEVVTFEE